MANDIEGPLNGSYSVKDALVGKSRSRKGPGRPKTKKDSNPSMSQMINWGNQDVERWFHRDSRMRDEQLLYELTRPKDLPEGTNVVVMNDPQVIVHKLSGFAAKRNWNIIVYPKEPDDREYARKIRNALMYWEHGRNMKWVESGHERLAYDEAFYCFERGMIAGRVAINPKFGKDDEINYPWRFYLADPANVYPVFNSEQAVRVTYRQWLTPKEIVGNPDFPDADDTYWSGVDHADRFEEILSIYAYDEEWDFYAAITKSGYWLRKPKEVNYMPWVIVSAAGAPYRATKWDQTKYYQRYASASILSPIRDQMKDLDRAMSMFQTMLESESNPATALSTRDATEIETVNIKPGSKFAIAQDSKINTIVYGPNIQHYENQVNAFQDRIGRATLPPSAYGGGPQNGSAMLNSQNLEGALDVIDPYVQAIGTFRELIYQKALKLFVDYFPSDTSLASPARPTHLNPSGAWEELTAGEIKKQGYHVTVQFDTMTTQERLAIANTVMALTKSDVIPLEVGRGPRWLNEPDPIEEGQQVIVEKLQYSPEAMQYLAPIFAAQTGQELLANIAKMLTAQQGGPGAPPGAPQPPPPMGGPQGPAPPMPPAGVVPPGALGAPTAPPVLSQLMQSMAGRMGASPGGPAMGGGGMGGVPPPPPGINMPPPPFR